MIVAVTTTPSKVLSALPGCEFLALQNDEAAEGTSIFLSFGGADANNGYRLNPGAELVLTNTSPLIKQDEVWASVAAGTANLRVTRR